MGHCPHCGKTLEEPCSFCPYCGKRLAKPAKSTRKPVIIAAVLAFALIAVLSAFCLSRKPFSEDTRAIREASASVVTIYTYDVNDLPIASGSGFAAIDEGIIVTNYHVIQGETYRIEAVTEGGTAMDADSVICYDQDKDIAILRFNSCTLTPLPTADGMDLERGEPLTAIGSPIGLNNMVSNGVLSQYLHMVDTDLYNLLFTASISHGSSGGALFDHKGNVVGVTSGGYEDANDIYLAVPFSYVTELYNNRSAADEITPAKLWEQTDHIYTVDYALYNPRLLSGKTIKLSGYVSAVYHDLYLVASRDQVISEKALKDLKDDERSKLSDALFEQLLADTCLLCQRESRGSFPDDLAGKYVTLRGKVTIYTDNASGDDVRFIVSEVLANE